MAAWSTGGARACHVKGAGQNGCFMGQAPSAGVLHTVSELLERGGELAVLDECLGMVRGSSRGCLVLVSGEAGIGKTVLLRRFCEASGGSARVLWGGCDSLFTPRALGPLLDIAQLTGGELARSLESGARGRRSLRLC